MPEKELRAEIPFVLTTEELCELHNGRMPIVRHSNLSLHLCEQCLSDLHTSIHNELSNALAKQSEAFFAEYLDD